jgi:hypothetical protein
VIGFGAHPASGGEEMDLVSQLGERAYYKASLDRAR